MTAELLPQVTRLLDDAVVAYGQRPAATRLRAARARLDEPLRVAIAGKVKAGKSTLLNALVGERIAPTDAGECTRIVTWYVNSHTSRVTAEPLQGPPRQLPFSRDDDGAIDADLGGLRAEDVFRLVIEWPSGSLAEHTLIDTPGIDSLSATVSARTHAFLTPDDEYDTPADAVLYLMRHLHASDVRFLEAFHDQEVAHATPINAIGVLSRADEVGVGRLDALETAARISRRYRSEPKVRRLCQTVLPVAGLLAESACTLRQDEFGAFRAVASAPAEVVERLLLSADRFAAPEAEVTVDHEARRRLLLRFGLFGTRLAVALVRGGQADSAPRLAGELRRRSGIDELRDVLVSQFGARRDVLKARTGLAVLETVLRGDPLPDAARLTIDLERITAASHEFAELRLLNALRTRALDLPDVAAAERLLGTSGGRPAVRLGLGPHAGPEEVRAAAVSAHAAWQGLAENPLASRDVVEAARVLVRTCEGILVDAAGATRPVS
jgi:hypothetical protein